MSNLPSPNVLWLLSPLLTTMGFLLALALIANLLRSRRPPANTLAWLLTIFFLPHLGVPLYLMFGGRKMRQRAGKKPPVYVERRESGGPSDSATERILHSHGVPPATAGNRVESVQTGEKAYSGLIDLIDRAERSIYITTYILGRDPVGEALVARLAARAADGLEVRLLLDDLGSWRVGRKFLTPLTEAGGQFARFMPMIHLPFRGRSNLRNHRKMVVIDDRHAVTGGMNLAAPYMGPKPDPKRWRDFALTVSGPAVADLADLFRSDWKFATGESLAEARENPLPFEADGTVVQVVASGPDVCGDPLYESLVSVFFAARKRIWVVTPYFIPDEMLERALDLAARRGVDVRLIVPKHSNHLMADLARASYLRQVDEAGGKVLLFATGMVHAKVVLVDDELAVVGSANMDMRSLFLNYEVALFLYSREQVEEISVWMEGLSRESVCSLWSRNRIQALAEDVVRLVSPLL